jgi:hypothetical protein
MDKGGVTRICDWKGLNTGVLGIYRGGKHKWEDYSGRKMLRIIYWSRNGGDRDESQRVGNCSKEGQGSNRRTQPSNR